MIQKSKINYLNTDLDLISNTPFEKLTRFLNKFGSFELHYGQEQNKKWFGRYEVLSDYENPEQTLRQFLKIIDRLRGNELKEWRKCTRKIFDIGYDCGKEPWGFSNSLSNETIKKIGALGAEIKITIYPEVQYVPNKRSNLKKKK